MAALHWELYALHQQWIRPKDRTLATLREYQATNDGRLRRGLERIGAPQPVRIVQQGSFKCATMTQKDFADVDIDLAVVFDADEVPGRPVELRRMVHRALLDVAANTFSNPPQVRTNAVTVWYARGYHVDFALYRRQGSRGRHSHEHAGSAWTTANPGELSSWFTAQVRKSSPVYVPGGIADGQLRRIVRYVKYIAQSRPELRPPGGLLLTVLTCESYRPSARGDDVALRQTLLEMGRRHSGRSVRNPVRPRRRLDAKREYQNQVRRWCEFVRSIEGDLRQTSKARRRALDAWSDLFRIQLD